MKTLKNLFFLILAIILFSSGIVFTQEQDGGIIPEKYPSIPVLTLPSPVGTSASSEKSESVDFQGGKILGHVKKETKEEKDIILIDGDVGILLKKDNDGGVLSIVFAEHPATPVKANFSEYPDGLHPQESELDGSPVEIEITPDKGYVHISLPDGGQISVEKIEFMEGAHLSDAESFDGLQIVIRPKFLPGSDALRAVFEKIKP